MIPLTNYDYSEGEQASVVMKFTQIDDANILETNSPRETRQKTAPAETVFFSSKSSDHTLTSKKPPTSYQNLNQNCLMINPMP